MSRDFDGIDDTINCGANVVATTLGAFSVASWVFPRTAGANTQGAIMTRSIFSASTGGWDIRFTSVGTNSLFFQVAYSVTNIKRQSSNNVIPLSKWSFIVLTWTGAATATSARFYVNTSETGYITTQDGAVSRVNDNGLSIIIGNNSTIVDAWDGRLAYTHLFNRVISTNEMSQLMFYPGSIRNGLIGFWPLYGFTTLEGEYSSNQMSGSVTGALLGVDGPPINTVGVV